MLLYPSNGAGATIVTSLERAKTLRQTPVAIKGFRTFNNTRDRLADDHMIRTARALRLEGALPTNTIINMPVEDVECEMPVSVVYDEVRDGYLIPKFERR